MSKNNEESYLSVIEKLIEYKYYFLLLIGIILIIPAAFLNDANEVVFSSILSSFGSALLALSIIGILFEKDFKKVHDENLVKQFSEVVLGSFSNSVSNYLEFGITKVLPNFRDFNFNDVKINERLTILQTWFQDENIWEDKFRELIKQKKKIQIILLNPYSVFATSRSIEYRNDANYCQNKNISFIEKVNSNFYNNRKGQIELIFYDLMPLISIYRFDEKLYCGLFWKKQNSIDGPFLCCDRKESKMYEVISENIENFINDQGTYNYDFSENIETNKEKMRNIILNSNIFIDRKYDLDKVCKRIETASEKVYILTTWMPNTEKLVRSINIFLRDFDIKSESIKELKILGGNQNIINERIKEIGKTGNITPVKDIELINDLNNRYCKEIDYSPHMFLIIIDEYIYFNPSYFGDGKQATSMAALELGCNSAIGKQLLDHFNQLWKQ
jgi:hypothetical protein